MDEFERIGDQPGFPMFSKYLGGCFRVVSDHGPVVELTLIEATAHPSRGNPTRALPFSVVFRGAPGLRLSQGTFAFEHDVLGAFEMFIVPIVPDEHGPRYEAVFN
ncbi:MAG: DUF6916 family protein [Isosphaeraceae bacterium]